MKEAVGQANVIAEYKFGGCWSPNLKGSKRGEKLQQSETNSTRQKLAGEVTVLFWHSRVLDVSVQPLALQGPPPDCAAGI